MRELKKKNLLKHAENEYLAAVLAAKVARRLHAMDPEQRPKPDEKVTSLALELINKGAVEFEVLQDDSEEQAEAEEEAESAESEESDE